MLKFTTVVRVRYADTDKMQFVYNGKYFEYFEVGRTELLRSIGLPYKEIEDKGYQLPLLEAKIIYRNAARYDDLLEIESLVSDLPKPKIHIYYKIKRQSTSEIIAEGYTVHIFMKADTKKAVRPPQFYIDALLPYIELNDEIPERN